MESKDLISLVEKLRQEQEFVSFYKAQIRQGVQDLNDCCNRVFHSLWLGHTLSHGLSRLTARHISCLEWSHAHEQADTVVFVDASKVLESSSQIDQYSRFLSALLTNPKLLSEVLRWVEMEGLDTPLLISDLMSVVYGHCVFQRDHLLFLQLLKQLMKQHIVTCVMPRDLFGGVEPIFSSVLVQYCAELIELRMFLIDAFQEPLAAVLMCEDYLEFDVNKAGSRMQTTADSNGPLLDSSTFLFSEDLEASCDQLAKLASLFLESLVQLARDFPLSLKWLLGSLKSVVQQQWAGISLPELRRPISDMLFGCILGSAIVNPDSFGIIEANIIVSPVARYNLSQISSVLQGCAWILDRPATSSNKYPIHKVVKRMNVKMFVSLVDTIDGGYGKEFLDLPSSLPGLRRSAYLASRDQLNNLVGLLTQMATSLLEQEEHQQLSSEVSSVLSHVDSPMREDATPSPYTISIHPGPSLAPRPRLDSTMPTSTKGKSSSKRSKPERQPPRVPFIKKRSSNFALPDSQAASSQTAQSPHPRASTFSSIRPSNSSEKLLVHASSQPDPFAFCLPPEVLILPTVEVQGTGDAINRQLWDFDLLSEEEFMGQRSPDHTHHKPAKPSTPSEREPRTSTDLIWLGDNTPPQLRKDKLHGVSFHGAHLRTSVTSHEGSPRSPSAEQSPLTKSFPPLNPLASPSCSETEPHPPTRLLSPTIPAHFKEGTEGAMSTIVATADPSLSSPKKEAEFLTSVGRNFDPLVDSGTHHSLENLLDDSVEEVKWEGESEALTSSSRRGGRFRKLKEKFGKRKQKSLEVNGSPVHPRKPRSRSERPRKHSTDTAKPRSQSEFSPQPTERSSSTPSPPAAGYVKRRSYTMLTGHITAKYQALDARQKSEQAPVKRGGGSFKAKSYESVKLSVAEMSPERFRKTLYCAQLQYKLRFALQNIHTPLTTSPVYLQLCADEDSMCDSRYQLITLVHHALQRSKWRHDAMEIALLTEILRMVEPLPNWLVAEVLEGVHEEHERRSVYIEYLVRSHQKFQEAKLQVAAVQNSMNRTKEVREDVFVNFLVKQLMESREEEMEQLVRHMSSLVLADERCSLMERHLESFTDTFHETFPWLNWLEPDLVAGCLEDHMFAHAYAHIFHPNGDSDMLRDQVFAEHLSRLSDSITPTHKSLQIPSVYHSTCPWVSAQKHLKAVTLYKSPRGKLRCVVQSCKILISLLQYARCGDPPGADDLFPVLVYVLIKTNPAGLLSTVQYVRNFAEGQLGGEEAYWWAQFSTAVEFTKTLE